MERFWVRADGGNTSPLADRDLGQWLGKDPKRLLVASAVPVSCYEDGQTGIAICFLETDDVYGIAPTMGPGDTEPDKRLEVWGIRESGEKLGSGKTAEATLQEWLKEAGYTPVGNQEEGK